MNSHSGHLRLRCLAAMGLASACAGGEGGTAPDVTSTATTTTEVTATAAVTVTATASTPAPASASVAYWVPQKPPPPVSTDTTPMPPKENLPTCPEGQFCVAEAVAIGSGKAEAPYGKCAESVKDPNAGVRSQRAQTSFDLQTTKRERKTAADACCYTWFIPCPGGRPLLVAGEPRVAPTSNSAEWSSKNMREEFGALPPEVRTALAEHYTAEARYEHGSVAAFSRVSLSLMACGAPADLLADTHRAALDEISHAKVAFALASAAAGAPVGPASLDLGGGLAVPSSALEVAKEAFFEGCVGEVAASLVLFEESAIAISPAIAGALSTIAHDEARHAELAWRTVAWALSADPVGVRSMLVEARALVVTELSTAPRGAASHALGAFGVTSPQERYETRLRAIREVVLPCLDALLSVRSTPVQS